MRILTVLNKEPGSPSMLKSYGTEAILLYFLAFFGGAAINRFGSSLVSLVDPSVSSASGFMDFGIVVFGFFSFYFLYPLPYSSEAGSGMGRDSFAHHSYNLCCHPFPYGVTVSLNDSHGFSDSSSALDTVAYYCHCF
ncbi:MAG: hypothetical protein WDN67_02400 [Candidatus Moraniibacteriota bacterium]